MQLHLQVTPARFAAVWNAAQAVSGVQIALGANAPFVFGRELWRESRPPLFQQATDTRPPELQSQGVRPRTWFGERWVDSVYDLFEENVRYFPALLPLCDEEDPLLVLDRGGVPRLQELVLHNGTVYRWNRPVYGWVDGVPHLRVENRVLPAGPTVTDVIANAAFYYGLVRSLADDPRPVWTTSWPSSGTGCSPGGRTGCPPCDGEARRGCAAGAVHPLPYVRQARRSPSTTVTAWPFRRVRSPFRIGAADARPVRAPPWKPVSSSRPNLADQ
ncbi:glutamate--cysteine ligase [Streptomyces tanashiensis]